jgi:hypothetical protein
MTADLSVSVDKFFTTSTSIRILRTMSQSKQTSPAPHAPRSPHGSRAPRAPRMPTTSNRSGEEDAAGPGPGMDFSSVDAFRASLAGYYGKCLFRWHRRLLLTAEPLADIIKKTTEPGSTEIQLTACERGVNASEIARKPPGWGQSGQNLKGRRRKDGRSCEEDVASLKRTRLR